MRPAYLLKKYREKINPPYHNKSDLIVLIGTILILIAIPLTTIAVQRSREPSGRAAAGTSDMFLLPATQSVNQNTNFSVEIREDSGTEPVNAIQADLTYDDARLDFVSVTTSAAFDIDAETFGSGGVIRIARGTVVPKTGDQLVATVTFNARPGAGATSVNFSVSSAVVASSDNTDILASTTGGTYTVVDPPPTVSLTSPTNNSVVSGNITVSATATDDDGVSRVDFTIDGSTLIGSDSTSPYSINWDTTSVSSGSHVLTAEAFDTGSNSSVFSVNITVDNQAPSAPTNLTATITNSTQIALDWTASTDNVGVTAYDVYRDSSLLATVATNSYIDTGLTPGTSYSYFVRARDNQGNVSAASNTVIATTFKRGDLNNDGLVNIFDLSILLARWRTADAVADINGDGEVNIFDLSILLSNWDSS